LLSQSCASRAVEDDDMQLPAPDARMTRRELAEALTHAGFKTAKRTLDRKACRGGGPPYALYGKTAIYQWGAALAWAQGRVSAPMATAAAHRTARRVKEAGTQAQVVSTLQE
jgi:hypothetical protein